MAYLHLSTGAYPLSEQDIRHIFPNTSFATPFTPPENFVVVFPAPVPTYDPITQFYHEIDPVLTGKGHWEQAWEVIDLDSEQIAANEAAAALQAREAAKRSQAEAISKIIVTTTSGKVFDGNEKALLNLEQAIRNAEITGKTETTWKMADNLPATVTLAEVKEAFALATIEKNRLFWLHQ